MRIREHVTAARLLLAASWYLETVWVKLPRPMEGIKVSQVQLKQDVCLKTETFLSACKTNNVFFFNLSLEFICSARLFLLKKSERVDGQTKLHSWIARVSLVRLASFSQFSSSPISQSMSFHSR